MTTEALNVRPAGPSDIDAFMALYEHAIEFQIQSGGKPWIPIVRERVERELAEGRQFKILEEDAIACIFLLTESDPQIWGERDRGESIYVHRIVTANCYHGRGYVPRLLRWTADHARSLGKRNLRIDTWADNPKLVGYYRSCGFEFLGNITMGAAEGLPAHYVGTELALLEMEL